MFKKLNTNTWKILEIFLEEPEKDYNVREIGRILKIAPATASKELSNLASSGVLKQRDVRMLKLFQADLENELFKDLKKFYNIRKIKDSGLVVGLRESYDASTIILAENELIVISNKKKKFPMKNMKKFEAKLGKLGKLNLLVIKFAELKDKKILNKIVNGDIMFGEIKWN